VTVKDEFVVDNGFVVAFTDGLDYKVESIGGMKSLFLSGEGFVSRFKGQGKIWVQTRQVPTFVWWMNPFRRTKRSNSGD